MARQNAKFSSPRTKPFQTAKSYPNIFGSKQPEKFSKGNGKKRFDSRSGIKM
jgi:hypothetical protein